MAVGLKRRNRKMGATEHLNVDREGSDELPNYLRLPELQRRLGISRSTIYFYVATQRLPPPIRLGARVSVWDEREVSRYIALARAAPVRSRQPRKGARMVR